MEENNKIIRKKIFENLIIAIAIMLYFILINFTQLRIEEDILLKGIKIASIIILFLSITIFEIAYHKDSGKITIYGIETLVLSWHTLTAWNLSNRLNIALQSYILFSTYAFAIYYTLKCIIIYTNEKRKYANSLSDIHEILKKEPVKKEAQKRENDENT